VIILNIEDLARKEILKMMPYVPGKPIDDVKREYNLEKVVKLASNENPLGPSPKAMEAIAENIKNVFLYPDGYAYNVRKKLSEKLELDMDRFMFGEGADELLELLYKAFVRKDDEVIYAQPSFVEYGRNTLLMGGNGIKIDLGLGLKHDLKAMSAAITAKTKMIIICNPNNPTGTIVTKEEVDSFLGSVPNNVLVIFDEAYYEYACSNEEYPNSIDYQNKGYKNVITLRTFSKAYGLAGLRIGYGIADKDIVQLIEKVRLPFNVGVLSLCGAEAAIDDKEHLKRTIELNEEGKAYYYSEFDKLGFEYPKTYSNFIYVDVEQNCKEVFENLLKEGVIVRPMFGTSIRITIGTMEENKICIEKLKKVLNKK
jgi:histidinol-phosphate aminotransferase